MELLLESLIYFSGLPLLLEGLSYYSYSLSNLRVCYSKLLLLFIEPFTLLRGLDFSGDMNPKSIVYLVGDTRVFNKSVPLVWVRVNLLSLN